MFNECVISMCCKNIVEGKLIMKIESQQNQNTNEEAFPEDSE